MKRFRLPDNEHNKEEEGDRRGYPFVIPELTKLIVKHAVIKGVFHTYAALLCVSHTFYRATSLLIRQHFTKPQILQHHSLMYHYGGKRLNLSFGAIPLMTNKVCARMTQLTRLNLDGCGRVKALTVAHRLTRLTHLSLNRCPIMMAHDLIQMTGLQSLSLRYNPGVEGERLTQLHSLTELKLSDTQYVMPSHLLALTQVTSLCLDRDHLVDKKTVSQMTWLRKLSLVGNGHIDGATLLKLSLLESLCLSDNNLIDGETLGQLTGLKELRFSSHTDMIGSDRYLSKLTGLESLAMVSCNKVTDGSVSLLTNLTTLSLNGVPHVTATSIKQLPRLRELTLRKNGGDIVLWDLTHLQDLVLRYDAVDFVTMGQIEAFFSLHSSNDTGYRQVKWKQSPKHYLEWHRY